ncbi:MULTISPECIES: rod shape-determining protein MreD [unclassified Tenacibaculum]|uniref:rod shape-determining protein MreD n=1 Tax=unclassified Tenacibaculum TaxID=2635139 RepID=UPI001F2266C9|nr:MULTISPECIES: rod shape-determining protein MreD [unclassified Tenacibaculum]MCF2875316.1 rod shape-determining protein MreD [Tenacibaculum sp. Cn5-1]MCF2935392.1 rod shape-determining protein MreD [Tenacibaculum sp. Cn5-34]MCG7511952.1 rod shape-determining protein MreD [Tenacibaculum sp. Cn5-46]
MNKTIYIIFLFVFLLLLQVLVLNNVSFLGYVNPYLYIVFVFLYPLNTNRFPFLSLAFLLGLCVDSFSNSGGMHAFSILFIAYIRLFLVKTIFKKTESDYLLFNLRLETFDKVFNYTVILTLIHHFILFSLINFSFYNFSDVLIKTLFSSVFTLVLYFLGSFIFKRKLA